MSNSSLTPPPEPSNSRNPLARLLRLAKRPAAIAAGATTIALVAIGYVGVRILIQKLPSLIEKELSETLNREVRVGKVQSFSLNRIKFGPSSIPPTPTDPDKASIRSIEIGFNPLPVLLRHPLPLSVTLVELDAYAAQDERGQWLDLDLKQEEGGELPFDLDIAVKIQDAEIALLPYAKTIPLKVTIEGTGRYNQGQPEQVYYDLNTLIANAPVQIKGETLVETGQTQAQLKVQNLGLAKLIPLIPNSTVDLNSGELNANLNINFPSFKEITSTRVQGTVSLEKIDGTVQPLSQPVKARTKLRFRGQKLQVEETQASVGKIVAQVGGEVDWQSGYNLDIHVESFSLANLLETASASSPVPVSGEMEVKLQLRGPIKQPLLTGRASNRKTVRIDKIAFKEIRTDFVTDLEKFVLKSLEVKPVAGGEITARGTIETQLLQSLQEKQPIDVMAMPLKFDLNAQLPTQAIAVPYYRFPSQVNVGSLTVKGEVRGTAEKPEASLKWQVPKGTASSALDISGAGELLLSGKNLLLRNTQLRTNGGRVTLNGSGNLESKKWQTSIGVSSVPLDPFFSQIQLGQLQLNRPITVDRGVVRLSGRLDSFEPSTIQGVANLALNVSSGTVAVRSKIEKGNLEVNATASSIPLDQFVPNLPVPVELLGTRVNLSGNLEQFLSSLESTLDLTSFTANANLQLAIADGRVNATSQLNRGQWQTEIEVSDIDSSLLSRQLSWLPESKQLPLPNLNAQLNLSGELNSLLTPNPILPIQAEKVSVQLGKQYLKARGNILLSNLTTAPDISSAELDVETFYNANTLPLTRLVTLLSAGRQVWPEEIEVTGQADFKGRLQGKNLLLAPLAPGNLALTGDLRLLNFSIQDLVFDSLLSGPVKLALGQEMAIDLRGKNDVIAARLEPCSSAQCPTPYLPASLEFRQGEGSGNPVIVLGKRSGDRFLATVEDFQLALLNIAPAANFGIPGAVKGKVNAELDLNLFTFTTRGNIRIAKPGVGYIQGEELAASFSYDRDNNLAQLKSASLQLGKSEYDLEGSLNLKSGEVKGELNLAKGYVEDILTTFRWSRLEDLTRLLQPHDFATAAEVQPKPIGDPDAPLANQLNLLWKIDKNIQARAARLRAGEIPTEIDIRGAYTVQATLAGTLKAPQVNFSLEGSRWQWHAQPAFLSIVEPLGLVKEDSQVIPVPEVVVRGSYQGGTIKVEPARVTIGDAVLALAGNLSAARNSARLEVKNFSLDLIRDFVNIPADIAGKVNAQAVLSGSLEKPLVQGEVAFVDGALNGRLLDRTLEGKFSYVKDRLEFRTTESSFIQVQASVPYPPEPDVNDRVSLEVKLDTEALTLVKLLTQGQVEWIDGEGEVTLNASGRLDLTDQMLLQDLDARGEVTLSEATVRSAAFPEPLKVSGQIALSPQRLKVEKLEGIFAKSQLSVKGVLPLFQPLEQSDPDSSNPLTVAIEQGQMNLEGLYEGEIDGQVVVKGAALSPVIGGEVRLTNGQVFVPEGGSRDEEASSTLAERWTGFQRWTGTVNRKDNPALVPKLDNFRVVLGGLRVAKEPLYRFSFGGGITVNGSLTGNLDNLQARGIIQLEGGNINLLDPTLGFLRGLGRSQFVLNRLHNNQIVFQPEAGLLNPFLDIQMRTVVSQFEDFKRERLESQSADIPDDTLNRVQRIDVTLAIKGEVSQLLPSLGKDAAQICQIRPDTIEPIPKKEGFSSSELQKLETCIDTIALESGSDFQLLTRPAVTLTSSPPRTEGDIIRLLSETQLQAFQNRSQEQLLRSGIVQFVIPFVAQDVVYDVEAAVGKTLGLANFQFFPFVEMAYKVDDRSFVKLSYDYNPNFNEVKLRYEIGF